MNKYVFRRAVAGLLITPIVAVFWVLFYALLVANGAGQSSDLSEVWLNGLALGVVVSLWFALDAVKIGKDK